jgi:hypothetical protein
MRFGVAHGNPDDTIIACEEIVDFLALDVCDLEAVPVGDAINDHLELSRWG